MNDESEPAQQNLLDVIIKSR